MNRVDKTLILAVFNPLNFKSLVNYEIESIDFKPQFMLFKI